MHQGSKTGDIVVQAFAGLADRSIFTGLTQIGSQGGEYRLVGYVRTIPMLDGLQRCAASPRGVRDFRWPGRATAGSG